MNKPLKTVFKTQYDGKEVELAVVLPSAKVKQHGRHVHARAYKEAIQDGAMLREELEGHLRNSKLWSDERQAEYERLRKVLLDGEKRLAKRAMKLSEARDLAIEMSKARLDLQDLLAQRNRVDQDTADAIADQAQFNYFVSHCTVYNENGKPFFTVDGVNPNTDVYVERGMEAASVDAATKLSEMMFGNDKDILDKLPENQFLKRYNFADGDYHLVDKNNRKVDEKGRLVDENGRFIDENGNFVDADGVPVDEEGRYIVDEEASFLDEDGNPIVDSSPKEKEAKPSEETKESTDNPPWVRPEAAFGGAEHRGGEGHGEQKTD